MLEPKMHVPPDSNLSIEQKNQIDVARWEL